MANKQYHIFVHKRNRRSTRVMNLTIYLLKSQITTSGDKKLLCVGTNHKKQTQKNCYCSWTKTFHKLENSNPTFSSRGTAETRNTHLRHVAASTRNWTNFKSEPTKPREEAPEGSVLIESKHRKRKSYRPSESTETGYCFWTEKERRILWTEIGEATEGIAECQLLPPLW